MNFKETYASCYFRKRDVISCREMSSFDEINIHCRYKLLKKKGERLV